MNIPNLASVNHFMRSERGGTLTPSAAFANIVAVAKAITAVIFRYFISFPFL
jgi:hypothetical protein